MKPNKDSLLHKTSDFSVADSALETPSMNLKFNEEHFSFIYIILILIWDVSMYYSLTNIEHKGMSTKFINEDLGNGPLWNKFGDNFNLFAW